MSPGQVPTPVSPWAVMTTWANPVCLYFTLIPERGNVLHGVQVRAGA